MQEFNFERLTAYQKSIDFADHAFSLSKKFSREVQFSLGEQFRRASLSISNNIAEGSGRRRKVKRSNSSKQHYLQHLNVFQF